MRTATTPSSSDPTLAAFDSPIGHLTLAARGGALVGVWARGQRFFGCPVGVDEAVAASLEILPSRGGSGGESRGVTGEDAAALTAATSWLEQYFAGENPSPARLHITPEGTHFQKHVWEAMARIPYGHTRTYSQIAAQLREAGVTASPLRGVTRSEGDAFAFRSTISLASVLASRRSCLLSTTDARDSSRTLSRCSSVYSK